MNSRRIPLAVLVLALAFAFPKPSCAAPPQTALQSRQTSSPSSAATSSAAAQSQPSPAPKITKYTLPPDRYQKARNINRIRFWGIIGTFVYGLGVLWLVLRWKLAARYRTLAENFSPRRFLQALVFSPLVILTIDILGLPPGVFRNWVLRKYGISIQGWSSWFWDWTKGELVSVIIATILIWILYAVIRKSPRRWWFYFWLASLPIGLFLYFLQPLIIDPLFFKFEPLAQKEPVLTQSLGRMVQRTGENIPPERMFWMGAGEKLTALNAYVTGFGASKRMVVWDTTIKDMNVPQIVFVAGHEMGHYVLGHTPKLLGFGAALLFAFFYVSFRSIGWVLSRWGPLWDVHGIDDWASLPALMLILSVLFFVANPVSNAFSRHYEHQADQYGLEVTHGLTPDAPQLAAQAFQILGEVDFGDPEPNPVDVFMFYDHPPDPDRVQFALTYDPWSKGSTGEFVK